MSEDMGNMIVLAFYAVGIVTWTAVLYAAHDRHHSAAIRSPSTAGVTLFARA